MNILVYSLDSDAVDAKAEAQIAQRQEQQLQREVALLDNVNQNAGRLQRQAGVFNAQARQAQQARQSRSEYLGQMAENRGIVAAKMDSAALKAAHPGFHPTLLEMGVAARLGGPGLDDFAANWMTAVPELLFGQAALANHMSKLLTDNNLSMYDVQSTIPESVIGAYSAYTGLIDMTGGGLGMTGLNTVLRAGRNAKALSVGGVPNRTTTGQKISEVGYQQRIERLESLYGTDNVHSLEKHGAQTTGLKQYRRVQQPHYPNPTTGDPGNPTKTASKFLTNKDHYEVLRKAILQRKANPDVFDFNITLGRNIGVNVKNLGSYNNRGPYSADYTNTARVRFDPNTGKFFTAFPIPTP